MAEGDREISTISQGINNPAFEHLNDVISL